MKTICLALALPVLISSNAFAGGDDQIVSYSIVGVVKMEVEAPPPAPVAPKPVEPPVEAEPRAVVVDGHIQTLERVYFVSGRAEARSQSLATLDAVAVVMLTAPHLKVLKVEAHTDSVSTDNFALSQRRAEWVRSYLIKKGVSATRLQAEGFGDTRPVAPNDTFEGRQANRRVEFILRN